jgi:Fe-S cluster biogenesis protein NfuA
MATELLRPGAPELVADVERSLEAVDGLPADGQAVATEAVRALLDLYGAGLERMVDAIAARDDGELARAFADDELIAHLLLLHGLHPDPVADRVHRALAEVRPYLDSHGGDVELVAIEEPVVRLRLTGTCHGCASSTVTLKLAIENAIRKAAPEIEEVVDEGVVPVAQSGLLQIELMAPPGECLAP